MVASLGLVVPKPGPVPRLHQVEQRRVTPARIAIVKLSKRVALIRRAIPRVDQDVISATARCKRAAVGRAICAAAGYTHASQALIQSAQVARLSDALCRPVMLPRRECRHEENIGACWVGRPASVACRPLQKEIAQAKLGGLP